MGICSGVKEATGLSAIVPVGPRAFLSQRICGTTQRSQLDVSTAQDLVTLADLLSCPRADVMALWHGRLHVNNTIVVAAGTSLKIKGIIAQSSIIDGAASTLSVLPIRVPSSKYHMFKASAGATC